MIGRKVRTFLDVIGEKKYALIGSGSCACQIIEYLNTYKLPLPVTVYDNLAYGKHVDRYDVQPLESIRDVEVLLLATLSFKKQMKDKVEQYSKDKLVVALSDFSDNECYLNTPVSEHPIIINTIPKCGNVFILSTLEKSLDIPYQDISAGPWPQMQISKKRLDKLVSKGRFSVDHIQYTDYNLGALKDAGIKKIVVHGRDPRQATLSWVHWLDARHEKGIISSWEKPTLTNYFNLSFSEKIDYQIENWLPSLCDFLMSWASHSRSNDIEILFSDFALMADTPENFFQEIYDFFGLNKTRIQSFRPRTGEMHFRKGLKNEWQQVFDEQQTTKSTALIPEELKELFGWE